MWFTFVGSWFSFLVQCICLTVLHDLQLPRRLEIILWLRTGPTGRFSYGSGSTWAASCPFGCGCGCQCSICLYPSYCVRARGFRRADDEVEDCLSKSLRTPRSASGCPGGQATSAGSGEENVARPGGSGRRAEVQRVPGRVPAREHRALLLGLQLTQLRGRVGGSRPRVHQPGVCFRRSTRWQWTTQVVPVLPRHYHAWQADGSAYEAQQIQNRSGLLAEAAAEDATRLSYDLGEVAREQSQRSCPAQRLLC